MGKLCVEKIRSSGEDSLTREPKGKAAFRKATVALGGLCQERCYNI